MTIQGDTLWQPGVDFTNILSKDFMCAYSKSVKTTDYVTVFFALLGSTGMKAACKRC